MSDADKRLKQPLPWKQLFTAATKKPGLLFGLGLAAMAHLLMVTVLSWIQTTRPGILSAFSEGVRAF